jgi:CheY-like chemotaxis protein
LQERAADEGLQRSIFEPGELHRKTMGGQMEKKRILVVDDSTGFRNLMVHVLDFMGYQAVIAEDGDEAICQLAEIEPILILMDVEMPGLNGYEACRRIRANPRTCDIPVLLLSGNGEPRSRALAAGADDFMAKPLSLDDLTWKIRSLTALRAPMISKVAA